MKYVTLANFSPVEGTNTKISSSTYRRKSCVIHHMRPAFFPSKRQYRNILKIFWNSNFNKKKFFSLIPRKISLPPPLRTDKKDEDLKYSQEDYMKRYQRNCSTVCFWTMIIGLSCVMLRYIMRYVVQNSFNISDYSFALLLKPFHPIFSPFQRYYNRNSYRLRVSRVVNRSDHKT